MIYSKPVLEPRWAPFLSIEQGVVLASDKDLFVGRQIQVTARPRDNSYTKFQDLFVFGRMRLQATQATLAFRTIYVFGTLECEGVEVKAARVVLMTWRQFLRGLFAVQNQPISDPADLNNSPTIRLSNAGCKRIRMHCDINESINGAQGFTGLLWAIHTQDVQLVRLFIGAGANLETRCNQWTALGWAVNRESKAITEMLVEAGADPVPVLQALQKSEHQSAFSKLKAILLRRQGKKIPSNVRQTFPTQPRLPLPTIFEDHPLPSDNQRIATLHKNLNLTSLDMENSPLGTRLEIYKIAATLNNRRTSLTPKEFTNLHKKMLNKEFMAKHCSDPQMYSVFQFVNRQVQRLSPHQ